MMSGMTTVRPYDAGQRLNGFGQSAIKSATPEGAHAARAIHRHALTVLTRRCADGVLGPAVALGEEVADQLVQFLSKSEGSEVLTDSSP